MKKLELDIKCCKDCPCLKWRYGLNRYTCLQSDAIIFVRNFLIHIDIHSDCPFPNFIIIDAVEKDWVDPRPPKCPKCGSADIWGRLFDTITPVDALLFYCGSCGEYL
jgi:hypothetical protein